MKAMFLVQAIAQTPLEQDAPVQDALRESVSTAAGGSLLADTFLQAGPVVKLVLLVLVMLSVTCWGIILYKYLVLRRAHQNGQEFSDLFSKASSLMEVYHASKNIPASPLLEVFEAGYRELSRLLASSGSGSSQTGNDPTVASLKMGGVDNVGRAMQKAKSRVTTHLERYLTFLATTGSTAPFIGLFGTVWGIMNAFRSIGSTGSANLATVAPGIAEALVATAVGLFAAIPAVVAYNFFIHRVRVVTKDMENFSTDLINSIERHLRKTS
jgi:biopolymer transport protein TolQ